MKECNPKTKKDGQICNPKTGRWIFKHTKLGQQLLLNKNINKSEPDILSMILNKVLKKEYDIYSNKFLNTTKTRSEALLYQLRLKSSKNNFITRYFGRGNSKHVHSFIKIVKIKDQLRIDPSFKEIELHKLTNKLFEKNVLPSFVYSFNSAIFNKNYARINESLYTILATEDISDYQPFTNYLHYHKTLPDCIIFQLLYTLHTLNTINLRHMDLHGNNMYIKTLSRSQQKMIKYEIIHKGVSHSFFVPTTHTLKIIDLDGGFKGVSNKKQFKEEINNPQAITGKVQISKSKANILKVAHTLVKIQPAIKPQMIFYGIMSNKGIPFNTQPTISYNKNTFTKYGLLVNNLYKKNTKFLNVSNDVVWSISKIMDHYISLNMYREPQRFHVHYSQKYLFD